MYEYADKVMSYLNARFIDMFNSLKGSLLGIDEVNALQSVKALYRELDELVKEMMYRIAVYVYEEWDGEDLSHITDTFLAQTVFEEYDPVLKYIYENEVERKASRLFESLVATEYDPAEVDTALRLWSAMINQYAITVTDVAALTAYKDSDVEYVEWVCKADGKQCSVCDERNGHIYPIDSIPSKPHIGCRCELIPCDKEDL